MGFTKIYLISPLTFVLKANLMLCTVMSQCGINEFRRQFQNTSGYQCIPCRECPNGYREVSLCSNVTDTECEQCSRGTFYRLTHREKVCQKCRQCFASSNQLECMNDTHINCSSHCPNVKTLQSCKTCSVCRKNEFEKISCSATEDTVCKTCKQCKRQHFIARKCSRNRNTHCKRCRKCIKGKTYLYKKCKRHRDTQCKSCTTCPQGYYVKRKCTRRHDTICVPCSADNINDVMCNRCPQGTFYEKSTTNQSVCMPCAQGTYMDRNNHSIRFCKRCRRCGPNEEAIQECNATHDRECGACSKGFFRLPSSHSCVMCSDCLKNLFNSTSLVVDECRRQMNDTNKVCMPAIPSVLLVVNASLVYRLGMNQDESPVYNETHDLNETTSTSTRNQTMVPTKDGDGRWTSPSVVQTTVTEFSINNHNGSRIKPDLTFSENKENYSITTLLSHRNQTHNAVKGNSVSDIKKSWSDGFSTYTIIVMLISLLILIVALFIILRILMFKFKRKRTFSLKKHGYKFTVSKPTLFSTNSITECFDLSIQYSRTNPKYNSDPDFQKSHVKRHYEALCSTDKGSCVLNSKSRSLGTVNAVELEFWSDRSLPRSTTRYNA